MDDLGLSPSQIIFNSIKSYNHADVCYGFGRQEPYVPFIFKTNPNEFFFTEEWSQNCDGVKITINEKRKFMKIFDSLKWNYSNSSIAFLCAIAESCIFRANLAKPEKTRHLGGFFYFLRLLNSTKVDKPR